MRPARGCGSGAKPKGALYRETLQTTGSYVGRVLIVPREFAPISSPPLRGRNLQMVPIGGMRFSGMTESIGPMWSQKQNQKQKQKHLNLGAVCRLPLLGTRAPVRERDGRSASCSSSAMSSGRLFLDRVARQHCPSPLHRQSQNNTHLSPTPAKQDISTLQGIGNRTFLLCVDSVKARCVKAK
jgi:hypothetical protein